ncbi:MAG TPA: hypothetical protein PK006_02035 [Saprospiraceae bacterium]|nr:hypothetical protein [Saprospiraceae bacterium]
MKKVLLLVLLAAVQLTLVAQEPEKDVKKADKLYGLYNLDPKNNKQKIFEAKALIDEVSKNPAVQSLHKTWITKGGIYNSLSAMQNDSLVLIKNHKLTDPSTAVMAYEAFVKAKETAAKGFETKDALNGMQECVAYLQNFGYNTFATNKDMAFKNFEAMMNIDKALQAGNMKSVFIKSEDYLNQVYVTALAGLNSSNKEAALPYLEELRAKGYNDENGGGATVYQGLYEHYLATKDTAKAESVLVEGRTKYPNDNAMLFMEINHYLNKGRLSELTDKLKLAIQKEPNNVSIYTTLGNVYENLCQTEWEKGTSAKADEYASEAGKYYGQALEKDPNNFVATYSLGAMQYNKAAQVGKEVNKYASDYSKEGTKKYNEKKAEMNSYFDKALPFFEKAIQMDPKDKNTIIALKEIYAKKGDLNKSNEMKAKLETLDK